ncbi:MAG: tetratricopeptide repeat protein [Desulfobacter sp.]|nr:MAG: tetratricopeptide repeat protein [Desulfobacter sp.]
MKSATAKALAGLVILVLLAQVLGCASPEDKKLKFMDKGDRLFSQRDYSRARLEYRNVLQIDPKFAKGYAALGKTQLKLKQFKKAYASFSKAVELAPNDLSTRIELGKMLLAGRASDRAMAQAEAVLAADPEHLDGNLLKVSAHYMKKEFAQGDELLNTLYHSGRLSPDLYMLLATSAKRQKNAGKRDTYLKEGLEKYPDNVDLILLAVQRDAGKKDWGRVIEGFERVITLKPDTLRYRISLAKVLLARQKTDRLQEVLDEALERSKENPETRLAIARFWISARKPGQAVKLLENGIALDPENFDFRLALADIHAGTRQIKKAEGGLRNALKLNPDPAHPQIIKTKVALARLLLTTSRPDQGETLIEQVLKEDPKNVDAHFIKGRIHLGKKNGLNAVSEFRTVVEKRPSSVKAHLNLASAHMICREPDLAMEVLKAAHKAMPRENELLNALARLNIIKKDYPATEANLKQAIENQPETPGPRIALGDFYTASRDFDKALVQYRKAREKAPANAMAYLKAASVLGAQKKTKEAMDELKIGYAENPNAALIVANMVRGYMALKKPDLAESLCRERLEKAPKEAFTWNLLGNVLLTGKKSDQAMAAYEKAAAYKPLWDTPYDNMARVYLARGEKEAAVKRFKAALTKNPKNMGAWMVLGSIYTRDKNYAAAARTYEQAFENNPRLWAAANNFAFTQSELTHDPKKLGKAMEYAQKALALNPGSGVVLDTLGWIQYKLGETEQARNNVAQALEQMPDSPILNYHMGMILDRLGHELEARSHLEKSLASGKNFPGAGQAESRLKDIDTQAS